MNTTGTQWNRLLAPALALVAMGCGPADAPRAFSANPPRAALIMKSLANKFFLANENDAKAQQPAHAAGYELLANSGMGRRAAEPGGDFISAAGGNGANVTNNKKDKRNNYLP